MTRPTFGRARCEAPSLTSRLRPLFLLILASGLFCHCTIRYAVSKQRQRPQTGNWQEGKICLSGVELSLTVVLVCATPVIANQGLVIHKPLFASLAVSDEADVRPAASYDEADVRRLESGDLSLFTFAGVHELIGEPCGEEFHVPVTP